MPHIFAVSIAVHMMMLFTFFWETCSLSPFAKNTHFFCVVMYYDTTSTKYQFTDCGSGYTKSLHTDANAT